MVKEHRKFSDVEQMKTSTLKRFLRQEHIADLLELHRLDRLSSRRNLDHYHFCLTKLEESARQKRPYLHYS
jgi:poly(A) polymerase